MSRTIDHSPAQRRPVALVTGSSRGIGRAVASRLARDGALVVVHYATGAADAEAVVREIEGEGGQAFTVGADIGSVPAIDAMFAAIDAELARRQSAHRIDVLVNNAGILIGGPLETVDEATYDRLFATNMKGPFFVTQRAAERMETGGRIIFLSSLTAVRAIPTRPLYGATKGAINSLTLALAQHLGPRGITVNAIMAGTTRTDGAQKALAKPGVEERVAAQIAAGRIGEAEDIADMVAALASHDARWSTGQCIAVTGGQQL